MSRIRKQRETASGREAASVWTRPDSPSIVGAAFAPGAHQRVEAASLNGALEDTRLVAPELSGAFVNRQVLN